MTEAAACVHAMYMNHSSDPQFWVFVAQLVESLNSHINNKQADVFNQLLPDVQVYLLMELANRQTSAVNKLNMLLLLLRRFPQNVESFGADLLKTVRELQANKTTLRVAQLYLGAELAPLLIGTKQIRLDDNECLRLYYDCLTLILQLAVKPEATKNASAELNDVHLTSKLQIIGAFPWKFLVDNVMDSLCKRYRYASIKAFQTISTQSIISLCTSLASADQLEITILSMACLIWLLVHYHQIYTMAAGSFTADSAAFVLISFDADSSSRDQADESAVVPMKKRKFDASGVERRANLMLPSGVTKQQTGQFAELLAAGVHVHTLLGSRCDTLINQAFSESNIVSVVSQYTTDSLLFEGKYTDVIDTLLAALQSSPSPGKEWFIGSHIRLSSCYYNSRRTDKAIQHAFNALALANQCAEKTSSERCAQMAKLNACAHYAVLPCQLPHVLAYTHRLVQHYLLKALHKNTQHSDVILGHLLVLSQVDPSLRELVYTAVQSKRSLTYPNFFEYVFDLDILETVSYWTLQQDTPTIHLQLLQNNGSSPPAKRLSTRTVHKNSKDKEGLRSALENQVIGGRDNNSRLPIPLIIAFLLNEQTSIIECVS